MICPNCNAEIEDGSVFCSKCGKKIIVNKCPNCDTEVKDDDLFCPKCGTKLSNESEKNSESEQIESEPIVSDNSEQDVFQNEDVQKQIRPCP